MDSRSKLIRKRLVTVCFATMATLLVAPVTASAQVRVKKPDRGVYQSPTLTEVPRELPSTRPPDLDPQPSAPETTESENNHQIRPSAPVTRRKKLVEVELEVIGKAERAIEGEQARFNAAEIDSGDELPTQPQQLRRTSHQKVMLRAPLRDPDLQDRNGGDDPVGEPVVNEPAVTHARAVADQRVVLDEPLTWTEEAMPHQLTCDGCPECVPGCDSMGCDSMGTCCSPWYRRVANASLSLDPNCWFGNIELLLMWRRGEHLPPLVTTSADPDPDTAGEIGQSETRVLVGVDSVLKDLRAGGRLTLGTWLDRRQCRSLVMRGWFAGEETFGFGTNQTQTPAIFRPFLDVSNDPAEQNTVQVAFPDVASGAIAVQASNDVFGADVSVRQFWYGNLGGTVDFLYGYQYMRMNEDLSISSTSTSLVDDPFRPLGSIIAISDSFDIDNEFHGGQVGVASRYREGCYSFDLLAKVGFGSLTRRAKLSGSTLTSNNGVNAVEANGLLVGSTNTGTFTDHTFGWVPELDISLGWHRFPRFDLTCGYHIIAMTEALRASEAIDPQLAVNLDPLSPQDPPRPAPAFRYSTYYVQGIHFGLQYVY